MRERVGERRAAPRRERVGAGLRRLQRVAFEVRLLAQDPLFEPAQLGPRLEPELAVQGLPQAAVRGEGVGLPARGRGRASAGRACARASGARR